MNLLFSLVLILSPLAIPTGKVPCNITIEGDMAFYGYVTEKTFCAVELDYKNNTYYMYLSHSATIDQFVEIIISFGNIEKTNNIIHFSDIATGLKMTGKLTDDNIRFIDGMSFLKNIKFEQSVSDTKITIPVNFTLETAKKKREKLHNDTWDIDKNLSSNYYHYIEFEKLELNEDNTFIYNVFDVVIAKGVWIRDHNIIKMTDTYAKCDYYLIIHKFWSDKIKVQSMLLPGDNEGWWFLDQAYVDGVMRK